MGELPTVESGQVLLKSVGQANDNCYEGLEGYTEFDAELVSSFTEKFDVSSDEYYKVFEVDGDVSAFMRAVEDCGYEVVRDEL